MKIPNKVPDRIPNRDGSRLDAVWQLLMTRDMIDGYSRDQIPCSYYSEKDLSDWKFKKMPSGGEVDLVSRKFF